jgi:putrescine transport system ATP-binding protein
LSQTTADARAEQPPDGRDPRPFLSVDNVVKRFGDVLAVDHVTLDIHEGEFFSLLGGSGCGKTTLLRILAGLEVPSAGRVFIDGQDMTRTPPFRRPVNMMFQSYALFPHMNVYNNVAFGLKQERVSRSEIRARVAEALAMVELGEFGRRRPDQLSGGQKQRVALARALVKRPKLLLLDEPLAALDKKLRERTQLELARIQERVGITFVLVTHDQEEAMNLSSRIAVMQAGRLEQVGTPREIYENPANRFVAGFVGSANLLECLPGAKPGQLSARHLDLVLEPAPSAGAAEAPYPQGPVWVALRPEKIALEGASPADVAQPNAVVGRIEDITYLGAHSSYHVRVAAQSVFVVTLPMHRRSAAAGFARGDNVRLTWAPDSLVVLPA